MSKNSRRNANRPDGDALRANLQYVDIEKHWPKIRPLAEESKDIWLPQMLEWEAERQLEALDRFGYMIWEVDPVRDCPADFDHHPWRWRRKGRHPQFWDNVCSGACHFLANLNIHLAEQVFTNFEWRIVKSGMHSTCWNGDHLVFDMTYLALGAPIDELVRRAFEQSDTTIVPVGAWIPRFPWSKYIKEFHDGVITADELLSLWPSSCQNERARPHRKASAAAA